ncbi:MAG: class I SAM-dependent methyltransferase [Caldimonas sp.]
MNAPATDTAFAGSIPKLYETLLVPLIFQPYADDLAARVAARAPQRVLEVAAGTGVVTRRMAALLPEGTSIVATDLSQAMLDQAATVGTPRPVRWQQADAMQLPFADGSVDAVVCQFGVMFFPDKAMAFAEACRILAPGGTLYFNAWDRIAENEFADTVMTALQSVFPDDPPRFMARVPHGYNDLSMIAEDLKRGGFGAAPEMVTVSARSRAASARTVAMAYCMGTPWRNEIEARDRTKLEAATNASERVLAARFGDGPVDGKIQAHVVVVRKAELAGR